MKERSPGERARDFDEVSAGYTPEEAAREASRCLQCKKPSCREGCPVEIDIPGFVKAIAENDPAKAAATLKEKNNLPAVCGRVCPQEEQCELKCVLSRSGQPVAIGNLERYAADWEQAHPSSQPKTVSPIRYKGKIAVVGSGPAGLTCAGDLAAQGFDVTIFESLHDAGGVLRYGIPEFRLPELVLDNELHALKDLGVKIELNSLVGRTKTLDELFKEGFRAVFIGTGAGLPGFLNIPGEHLNNIYSANEFLVRVNLMSASEFPRYDTPVAIGTHVAVIGGGNTAMDASRTAVRLGAKTVTLIYRRTEAEMPARRAEIHHAKEEGIQLAFLTSPVRFIGDNKDFLSGIECIRMELGAQDDSGRRRPQLVPGSNFVLSADMAIIAVGSNPNPLLPSLTRGLTTTKAGHIFINDHYMTSIPGVFAGGDIVSGETVIQAMGMGKRAARAIEEYLNDKQSAISSQQNLDNSNIVIRLHNLQI